MKATKVPGARCEKCGAKTLLQGHHQHPKRFYHGSGPIVVLCLNCHREIEKLISHAEKSVEAKRPAQWWFDELTSNFLEVGY